MVLDIVLGTILLASVFAAARNGLTKEIVRVASLIAGIVVALWGHGVLAPQLRPLIDNGRLASFVAFAVIFLGVVVAGVLLAHLLVSVWEWTGLRWLDMALGAGFGLVRGVVVSAAVLLALLAFQPFRGTPAAVAQSRISPWVMNVARTAAAVGPQAIREAFVMGVSAVEEMQGEDDA